MLTRSFVVSLLIVSLTAASGCSGLGGMGGLDVVSAAQGDFSSLYRGEEEDWDDACDANTRRSYAAFLDFYPSSKYAPVARKRIEQTGNIDKNWSRLKRGMSVYEVDRLVGPLTEFPIATIKRSKDASSDGRKLGGERLLPTLPYGTEVPYSDDYCKLSFDAQGNLLKWERY